MTGTECVHFLLVPEDYIETTVTDHVCKVLSCARVGASVHGRFAAPGSTGHFL